MADYIGAIDQGTTSTRFIVFDRSLKIVSVAQKEHRQIYPQPGWVEHDPEEIWSATKEVVAGALQAAQLHSVDLAAIGIANQRETAVLWDRRTGQLAANAIVWQDTRTARLVAEVSREGGANRFQHSTGLPVSTYFSSLKVRWLLDHLPGLRQRSEQGDILFGTVDTFLVWKLTGGAGRGVHLTDVTNASRTQLMNIERLSWDGQILATLGIPAAILPQIRSSSEFYAEARVAPLEGVPIAGLLGDQQAALVGQTCFEPGEAKNTYGTGCFLLMNTGANPVPSQHGLLTTVAYKLGHQAAQYALEGSVAMAGALVQWLRDNLGIIRSSSDVESLARSVPDNGGVYFVPAFSGLYAPYWKPDARGVIAGLTRFAHKGHLARAVLEATAFQVREIIEAIEADSKIKLDVLRVDGGMTANQLLMQFQSDILNRPVLCPAMAETAALGAAFAAGVAVGFFNEVEELRAGRPADREWRPQMEAPQRESLYRLWKKAVTRTFDWIE
jgi:glycerol kinase